MLLTRFCWRPWSQQGQQVAHIQDNQGSDLIQLRDAAERALWNSKRDRETERQRDRETRTKSTASRYQTVIRNIWGKVYWGLSKARHFLGKTFTHRTSWWDHFFSDFIKSHDDVMCKGCSPICYSSACCFGFGAWLIYFICLDFVMLAHQTSLKQPLLVLRSLSHTLALK